MIICISLSLAVSVQASQFLVGVNGGSASFDSDFDSSQEFGVHAIFASRSGMAIDASLSYFEADGKNGGDDVSALPLLVGMSYIMGRGPVVPYIGAMGGLTVLGGDYSGSAISYGAKLGLSFRVSPDFRLFLEGRKLYINEDSGTIEPTTISLGASVIFGKNKVKRPLPFMQRAPHGEEFKKRRANRKNKRRARAPIGPRY